MRAFCFTRVGCSYRSRARICIPHSKMHQNFGSWLPSCRRGKALTLQTTNATGPLPNSWMKTLETNPRSSQQEACIINSHQITINHEPIIKNHETYETAKDPWRPYKNHMKTTTISGSQAVVRPLAFSFHGGPQRQLQPARCVATPGRGGLGGSGLGTDLDCLEQRGRCVTGLKLRSWWKMIGF